MKKKRVLIIDNSIQVTGALNAVLRTSIALKSKYDFVFALPLYSRASAVVKEKGFNVIEVPMQELSKRWQSILFYLPNLIRSTYLIRRIAAAHHISFVHVNDFYNLIMPLWRLCGGKTPYICHVNFVPERFPRPLQKLWINSHLKFSSKIVAVSNYVLKQLPVSNKIVYVPNALPAEQHDSSVNHERRKVLLFLGNFMEGKGQDLAIRSFSLVAHSHPNWKLRMVGGDMGMKKNKLYKNGLMTLANELKISNQIEWSDFSDDVSAEYQQASIALNFSKSESFSLTVQEAMFYGCPVIATNSGGPAELIDDNDSGLLVPVDDINAMSQAMTRLIENPDERLRLMNNASQSVRIKFSWPNTVEQLDRIYGGIL